MCAADEACAAAYPDLRAVFVETVERLDAMEAELSAPLTPPLAW